MSQVVLVTGVARSGTATLATVLSRLGWAAPSAAAPSVVALHRRLLDRSPVVRGLDARPEAASLAAGKVTDDDRDLLVSWLADQPALVDGGRLVVEDPRALWFAGLWRTAAAAAGLRFDLITVLRHPAEVARARSHDPAEPRDAAEAVQRRHRAVADVGGWVGATLSTAAGRAHTVVRHADLFADPGATIASVLLAVGGGPEGSTPDPAEAVRTATEVVAGIDGAERLLESSGPDWEATGAPAALRAVAEDLWHLLAGTDPADEHALARIAAEHARIHEEAVALALDHTFAAEVAARRTVRANLRSDYEAQVAELEQQLEEAHGGREDGESRGSGSEGYDGYADARADGTGGWFRRR